MTIDASTSLIPSGIHTEGYTKASISPTTLRQELFTLILRFLPKESLLATAVVSHHWKNLTIKTAERDISKEFSSIKGFTDFLMNNLNHKLSSSERKKLSEINQSTLSASTGLPVAWESLFGWRESIVNILITLTNKNINTLKLSVLQPMPPFFASMFKLVPIYKRIKCTYHFNGEPLCEKQRQDLRNTSAVLMELGHLDEGIQITHTYLSTRDPEPNSDDALAAAVRDLIKLDNMDKAIQVVKKIHNKVITRALYKEISAAFEKLGNPERAVRFVPKEEGT